MNSLHVIHFLKFYYQVFHMQMELVELILLLSEIRRVGNEDFKNHQCCQQGMASSCRENKTVENSGGKFENPHLCKTHDSREIRCKF